MTYTEFLAQTDYDGVDITALDDQAATDAATLHTQDIVVKIDTPIRKTAVETVFTMNSTEERLVSKVDELDSLVSPTAEQLTQLSICRAILRSISKLFHPEYYINLSDPDVAGMLGGAEYYGLLTPTEVVGIRLAAAKTETPFAYKTLNDTKAIRYPATWLGCTHPSDGRLLSVLNQDIVTFSASLLEEVQNVEVRCYWSTAVGQQEFLSNHTIGIRGTDGLYVSQSFTRANLGLPTTAKVLRFEYTSIYDGVVYSVSVSK